LADVYVTGSTDRVSREAPVLIVRVEKEETQVGGAANVASNLSALGADVKLSGVVGKDPASESLRQCLRKADVKTETILTDPTYSTVCKTRILAGAKHTLAQQVLRLDREPEKSPSPQTMKKLFSVIRKIDSDVDGWIISDYGYGTIGNEIISVMAEFSRKKPVLVDSRYDINRYVGMTAIKPNEQEALEASGQAESRHPDIMSAAETLIQKTKSGVVIITLGNKGMLVYENSQKYKFVPTVGSDQIVDLTGAGDTAGAAILLSLAAGADYYQSAEIANCAGAVVVMKYGCASCYPNELTRTIDEHLKKK
jgi:rfaE bifunctional protein kinase chain/domain